MPAQLDLQEPGLSSQWRALLDPLLHAPRPTPDVSAWDMLVLAHYGHHDRAADLLEVLFTDPERLHADRSIGAALMHALSVHRLGRDRDRLRALWPRLTASAHWIAESLRSAHGLSRGKRPSGYGLMPAVGESASKDQSKDLSARIVASATCWRGLRDAAQAAALLGEDAEAKELRLAAHAGRRDLLLALAQVPAGAAQQRLTLELLATGVLGWRGPQVTELLRDPEVKSIARTSAIHARALQHARLQRRDFADYEQALRDHAADDPVLLLVLRDMLCCEERSEEDEPTGTLWLLPAVPAAWFATGASFGFQDLPTAQGPISLGCKVDAANITFTLGIAGPLRCVLFYVDRAGRRRSLQHTLRTLQDHPEAGAITVVAPR